MAIEAPFFVVLGSAVGFGSLIMALISCYFINPVGLWSIKLVMGPFLAIYIINGVLLAYYVSRLVISYLPSETTSNRYVQTLVKFGLSVALSASAAKLWNAYRFSALCIRFCECTQEDSWIITGMNSFTDAICGPVDAGYTNDSCRRWLAQTPLILLSLLSLLIVSGLSRAVEDKFSQPLASMPTGMNSPPAAPTTTAGCDCNCHRKNKPSLVTLGSVIRNALR